MLHWTADDAFEIAGVDYACCPLLQRGFQSQPGRFCLVKPPSAVRAYEQLLSNLSPRNVVEVGIYEGASTALIAEIARPVKLLAIDLSDRPLAALDDFIARRDLEDVVSVHRGVQQDDARALRTIVADQLGSTPIDLVVDDASHDLDLTRRTFNALFPLLRPGGMYLIEDWWWAHTRASEMIRPDDVPLSVMVFELVLACAYEPAIVSDVETNRNWTLVTRGAAALDPDSFDLAHCYGPRGRALVTNL